VLYRDEGLNKRIMEMQHSLDGRNLDIKVKDEQVMAQKHGGAVAGGAPPPAAGSGAGLSKTKIFVGRLLDDVEPEDLRKYFEQYGTVIDVFMPKSHATGQRKNVGFVEFQNPESCTQVLRAILPPLAGRIGTAQYNPEGSSLSAACQRTRTTCCPT
jgi:hypothetical protein